MCLGGIWIVASWLAHPDGECTKVSVWMTSSSGMPGPDRDDMPHRGGCGVLLLSPGSPLALSLISPSSLLALSLLRSFSRAPRHALAPPAGLLNPGGGWQQTARAPPAQLASCRRPRRPAARSSCTRRAAGAAAPCRRACCRTGGRFAGPGTARGGL